MKSAKKYVRICLISWYLSFSFAFEKEVKSKIKSKLHVDIQKQWNVVESSKTSGPLTLDYHVKHVPMHELQSLNQNQISPVL